MEFNQALGLRVLPKFSEGTALAPARDSRNTPQLWKKTRDISSQVDAMSQGLHKLSRQVSKQRRMVKGGFIAPNPYIEVLPFQIYNIANITNSADSWRTFQIRDGFTGARSKYWLNGFDHLAAPDPSSYWNNEYLVPFKNDQSYGNAETFLGIIQDMMGIGDTSQNQPQANELESTWTATQIKLDLTTDTLITGVDGSGVFVSYGQIVMADGIVGVAASDPSYPIASFWIEIVDDPVKGFYPNLWGRMCGKTTPGQTPNQQSTVFPSGNNIIPIGMVQAGTNSDGAVNPTLTPSNETFYYQLLTANLTGRFPALAGTVALPTIGQYQCFRGNWVQDSLSGQVFYPGDSVYDDDAVPYLTKTLDTGTGTFKYRGVYTYIGASPNFMTTSPHSDATNWLYRSALI